MMHSVLAAGYAEAGGHSTGLIWFALRAEHNKRSLNALYHSCTMLRNNNE